MNIETLAYAAGLFDGEGYVDIYKATLSKASKNISLMLRVVITQKDGVIMNWLEDNFGGYVQKSVRPDNNWVYHWDIRSKAAETFIQGIMPYVKIKKAQLELALKFQEMKSNHKLASKGKQGFSILTEQELSERLILKDKIKSLKKQYTLYI